MGYTRTVVVVDDQPEFLEIARQRLASGSKLQVVGEATSGQAVLELITQLEHWPDCVLLDVEMPGLDGLQTAVRLGAIAPEVRVILTSASNAPGYRAAAGRIGAVFLSKRDLTAEAVLQLLE